MYNINKQQTNLADRITAIENQMEVHSECIKTMEEMANIIQELRMRLDHIEKKEA